MNQSELHKLCDYIPETGQLIWRHGGRKRIAGKPLGSVGSHGYLETSVNRERHLVHRLVWLWHHGEFPAEHTDHINHNRLDNRIENLRSVTNRQNNFNQSKRKRKTSSQYRGVSWDTQRNKWKSAINLQGKQKFIGYFEHEKHAALAWNKMAEFWYGEYANLNNVR